MGVLDSLIFMYRSSVGISFFIIYDGLGAELAEGAAVEVVSEVGLCHLGVPQCVVKLQYSLFHCSKEVIL